MKKRILLASVLLIMVSFALNVFAAEDKAGEYKVGCLFAITGPASFLGEPERNTAEMIAKQINDAGGINGHKLVLFIEDTQGDNTRSINAAKKLIKKDNVCAIIGPSRSGSSMSVVPVVQEAKIPLISCAAAEAIVEPVKERFWVFNTPQKDSDAVKKIYDNIVEKKLTKIGIMGESTGFGAAGIKQLKSLAPKYKLEIVAEETYNQNDTDMSAQLIKIKNAGAQAIINWSIVPAQAIIPQNIKQLKITIPLYQSHGFGNIKYVKAAGPAADGVLFPAGRLLVAEGLADDNPQKLVLLKYKKDYETNFKEDVSTFGGHGYDSLWLVVNALKEVGDNPAKIRDFIEKTTFVGTGGVFKYSPENHNGLDKNAFELLTVKDGKFAIYKK